MNIKYVKRTAGLATLAQLMVLGLGCDVGLGNHGSGESRPASDITSVTVTVNEFSKIEGKGTQIDAKGNFDETLAKFAGKTIGHLAASGGVMYLAGSNGTDMWSWRVDKGDTTGAWKKMKDFTGSDPAAKIDLQDHINDIVIQRLASIQGGVAVGAYDSKGGKAALAAGFYGQGEKANWSSLLTQGLAVNAFGDMVEVSVQGKRMLFAPLVQGKTGLVTWLDLGTLVNRSVSFDNANKSILKFGDGAQLNPVAHKVGAVAALPDGRVALGMPDGLLTIKNEFWKGVEMKGAFEQPTSTDRLDPDHVNQFKTNGISPVRVGALRMVGDYLLITFVDDGFGMGGLKYALVDKDPKKKIIFTTNLDAPKSQVTRIVVDGIEARLISDDVIYSFRKGEGGFGFFEEFDGKSIKKANISKGFGEDEPTTLETFEGGATGAVPDGVTKFYDAAPYGGAWYYATSNGLFKVETKHETRRFDIKTKKAI